VVSPAFSPRDHLLFLLSGPGQSATHWAPPAGIGLAGRPRSTSNHVHQLATFGPEAGGAAPRDLTRYGVRLPSRLAALLQSSNHVLAASHARGSTTWCARSARRTSICRASLLPLPAVHHDGGAQCCVGQPQASAPFDVCPAGETRAGCRPSRQQRRRPGRRLDRLKPPDAVPGRVRVGDAGGARRARGR
jgi:hypothetical protein